MARGVAALSSGGAVPGPLVAVGGALVVVVLLPPPLYLLPGLLLPVLPGRLIPCFG